MQVLLLNNDGAGFADYVDIEEGMTIEQMLQQQLPHRSPEELLIRVNRQPVARDHVLQSGDRVSATPTKVEGATRLAA